MDYCIWVTYSFFFFTLYHKTMMLTDLGVLFTVFFLIQTVDKGRTPLLVDAMQMIFIVK